MFKKGCAWEEFFCFFLKYLPKYVPSLFFLNVLNSNFIQGLLSNKKNILKISVRRVDRSSNRPPLY